MADVIRTCLGPRAMLKMLLNPVGGIVMTNDGNAILREIDVSHPGAKSMIELSRAQDEEVGDGTTSVIILGALTPPLPLSLAGSNPHSPHCSSHPFLVPSPCFFTLLLPPPISVSFVNLC